MAIFIAFTDLIMQSAIYSTFSDPRSGYIGRQRICPETEPALIRFDEAEEGRALYVGKSLMRG